MSIIRVVAAVVDTQQLTLYKEDGTPVYIKQGDERLRRIVDEVMPILNAGEGNVAEVELGETPIPTDTTYADYEKNSGGITKFFRVLKRKVNHVFGLYQVEPQMGGRVPKFERPVLATEAVPQTNDEKMASAVDQIMAHAEPVSAESYQEADTTEDHTIVAVTQNDKGQTRVIPGVEKLKPQLAHATKLGNPVGMEAFLKRLANVIDHRDHSVQDVLDFMEKGDLPLADDGSIIAYKVLRTKGGDSDQTFVDCHTGKVTQKIGSFVMMDPSLVDRSRTNECSNGLHIARRGYLGSFSGNIIVMCKIAPEDVIAVPHRDPNKVRVCGYHILDRIPSAEHSKLRSNQAMEGTHAQKLLAMAIRGEHIARIEEVRITQQNGGGLKITSLVDGKVAKPNVHKSEGIATPLAEPVKVEEPKYDAPVVDAKAIAQTVAQTKAAAPAAPLEIPISEPRKLFNEKRFDELKTLKAKKKKSYDSMGFTPAEVATILGDAVSPAKKAQSIKEEAAQREPVKEAPKPKKGKPEPVENAPQSEPDTNIPAPSKPFAEMTRNEKAAWFMEVINSKASDAVKRNAYQDLLALKKKSKVSWSQLNIVNFDAIQAKFEK